MAQDFFALALCCITGLECCKDNDKLYHTMNDDTFICVWCKLSITDKVVQCGQCEKRIGHPDCFSHNKICPHCMSIKI